ncbi:hypothetical protein PVAND_013952 [Polypedilum vanderplanki]|uniref:Fatty acyl-CoA reductase n=1 Tax=Polypedilum vanderplanki TaxID=319348 RepID=A0A9J6CQX5_POLVA|nr:hypothetical protein PVAND_013952 [Polypedilum vanderplanki]
MRIISHSDTIVSRIKSEIFEINRNESEWTKKVPSIPEFYSNRELFVTGATGFIGKVLIEKLLRSCSDLKCIYILLRPKKGKSVDERLKQLIELPLFEPIKNFKPQLFDKLIPITGDVTEINLGLSDSDMVRMKNVSVIFHSAASVRFDDTLRYAVFMNTRGTREIMKFAKNLKNIKVLMHVSTTYSHPELKTVNEVIHEPYVDWKKTIEICERFDDNILSILTQQYTGFMPNTYTFTKALAEQVVADEKDNLPLALFRPSIVIASMTEPFPGWIDNFNGPIGLLVGSGLGITRTMYCDPDNIADFTPVDVCVKAMIISAWKRAHEPKNSLPIINCCLSNYRNATLEQIIDMGKSLMNDIPIQKMLWAPGGGLTRCRFKNFLKVIFVQLLPALIIDQILKAFGHKPFLAKLQRKIYEANLALDYFILNNWHFKNDNFMALCLHLKLQDLKAFDFHSFLTYDLVLYFRNASLGARKFLLGEEEDNILQAQTKLKRLKLLDAIIKTFIYCILFWYFLIKYDTFGLSRIFCGLVKRYHDY